jgi:hypothetical protein
VAPRCRRTLVEVRLAQVDGLLERAEGVTQLIVDRLLDLTALLGGLQTRSRDFYRSASTGRTTGERMISEDLEIYQCQQNQITSQSVSTT